MANETHGGGGIMFRSIKAAALADPYDPNASWDQVVAAAKKEGAVNVYSSAFGGQYFDDTVAAFTKTYGIKVNKLDARVAEMAQRVEAEQSTGKYVADIQQSGPGITEQQHARGWIENLGKIPNLANLRDDMPKTDYQASCYLQGQAILVNTDLAKPADVPKSWHDLLDPKWKGKTLEDTPGVFGNSLLNFAAFKKAFEPDFNQKWSEMQFTYDRDAANDGARVARGEYLINPTENVALALPLKGLPVKLVVPTEGIPYVDYTCSILRGGPHPNAARVYTDFFLSTEPQVIYANLGQMGVIKGLADHLQGQTKEIAEAKLLPTIINAAEQSTVLAEMKAMYKDK